MNTEKKTIKVRSALVIVSSHHNRPLFFFSDLCSSVFIGVHPYSILVIACGDPGNPESCPERAYSCKTCSRNAPSRYAKCSPMISSGEGGDMPRRTGNRKKADTVVVRDDRLPVRQRAEVLPDGAYRFQDEM